MSWQSRRTIESPPGPTPPKFPEVGDLLVGISSGRWGRLAKGELERILKVGDPQLYWGLAEGAAAHNLLSASHSDTLAADVVAGDIIIGNATPKWSRLAKGAAGLVLRSGATLPEWGQITTPSITDAAVTYAKIQNVSATDRFLGRKSAGAGPVEELTGTEATARLDVFTSTLKGLVPASGGGTTNFLRADGTWAAPPVGEVLDVLDAQTSTVDVVNTATETNLYSFSVPGGTLSTTRALWLELIGDVLMNVLDGPSVRIRAYYGATVIFDTLGGTIVYTQSATRKPMNIEIMLHAKGATNSQVSRGRLDWSDGGNAGNGQSTTSQQHVGTHNAIAVDSTTAQTFRVTAQWSSASTSASIRRLSARLVLIQ